MIAYNALAMFQLTREIRFAVNRTAPTQVKVTNGHGGYPSLVGLGHYFALQITLAGELEPASQYLLNIKRIDDVVRERAIARVIEAVQLQTPGAELLTTLFTQLRDGWSGPRLVSLTLLLSPFLRVSAYESELPMVRLSQKFEFSAAHRLHNPALSDAENREVFGKCNNPHGHGHNYELQVTVRGQSDANGQLIDVPTLERIVAMTVINRFDHKHLNIEVPEFRELIPSVENIAGVIYKLLKPELQTDRTSLASVTVWETPKTWCEYSE